MYDQEYRLDKDENVIPVKNFKKAVYQAFCQERNRIQDYIAANTNYHKDYNDNHKYNHIRDKLWMKKKEKESLKGS